MAKEYAFCDSALWVKITYLASLLFDQLILVCFFLIFKDSKISTLSNPDFTTCFENTVMKWVPCLILFLIGPSWILATYKEIKFKFTFNIYFILKLVCNFCIFFGLERLYTVYFPCKVGIIGLIAIEIVDLVLMIVNSGETIYMVYVLKSILAFMQYVRFGL
jgi:hypothetical protein